MSLGDYVLNGGEVAAMAIVEAVSRLGVGPSVAVAFEDSPNGVTAAKAAGLSCVAVPCDLTRTLGFDHADLRIHTLADHSLEALLAQL